MAAGDFSPSALLAVKLKAEQMWTDGQWAAELTPQAESAIAVLENQTARITPLETTDKDLSVIVNWLNTCAIVAEDCESNCDITEPEMETSQETYALDICKKTGFSVDVEKLRTNAYNFDEIVPKGLAACVKTLDEFWAKTILAKLQSFAGINVDPSPMTFNVPTLTTNTGAIGGTTALVPHLIQQSIKNNMRSSYLISDGTAGAMYVNWLNAQFNAGNAEGKGDTARANALKMYFDLFNFSAAGIGADLFLIGKGAVAFTARARNPDVPTLIGGSVQHTLFTVKSNALAGVKYDVLYTITCNTVGGKSHYLHTWRVETNGGVFLNPAGCPVTIDAVEYEPTGVLAYELGDGAGAPAP